MKQRVAVLLPLLILLGALAGCHRRPASTTHRTPTPASRSVASPPVAQPSPAPTPPGTPRVAETPRSDVRPSLPDFAVDAVSEREGEAMWYDVPAKSLAERRAWSGEMTAASDTLPLNTYVRVRQVSTGGNGRSVVVRITDRGIHRKGTLIDLDRPAAEALGMVSKGAVRVRVETLALLHADADKPTGRKDAATEPADQITSTPAASREQEKAAAAAKAGRPAPP